MDGGDGGELVNKLILSKDAPQGDVCFGVDNTYASRLLSQGVIDKDRAVDTNSGKRRKIPGRQQPCAGAHRHG